MIKILKYLIVFFSGLFHKAPMKKLDVELRPILVNDKLRAHPHPYIPYLKKHSSKKDKDISNVTSTNWSGYVALGKNVSSVSGSWVVPDVKKSNKDTYCAVWVGIDGYHSDSVEQIGTSHDYIKGKPHHYAWFEMYPEYPQEIYNFPVNTGDSISAVVDYVYSDSCFKMKLINNTKNIFVEIPTKHTTFKKAQRSSAEWIIEAPFSNKILPLSNFDMVFTNSCKCTIDGVSGAIKNNKWSSTPIDMVDSKGNLKAQTSGLAGNDQNFWVKWIHE